MKIISSILLFVILLRPAFPVLDYVLHYDFIKQELCQNKNVPQMHCNGKCHLKMELAKASDKNECPSSNKKITTAETVLIMDCFYEFDFSVPVVDCPEPDVIYSNLYGHTNFTSVFHPPLFS